MQPRFEKRDVKPVELPQKPVTVSSPDSEREAPDITTHRHQVEPGDSLSSIFSKAGAPLSDLQKIMRADVEYLALETLRPGTTLELTFDKQGKFTGLALEIDPARTVSFTRTSEGTFEYHKAEADTHWVSEVLKGSIEGSFYASARRAGLSDAQIASVRQVLEHKLDFRRELRAGDKFAVIVGHEMSDDQSTGKSRIEAATIERNSQTHTAFRFDDGNYYDEDGRSVLPAFRRWPTPTSYRVSSHFNPNRSHPVTGRRSPHNGVDLATPPGTTIMSTGDGIVKRVGNHPYAGKYVDIDHGNAYKTRYLHLNRILVKKGDKVERGHKIALSGNTGRSTGPHLHFELHIEGRPVDPLEAEIPTAADVASKDVERFEELANHKLAIMGNAASRSDLMLAGIKSSFD
ncbi:MAG: peptidoglycan DD-metalloendopeptidase family protein [Pseudomonadota bacterium]